MSVAFFPIVEMWWCNTLEIWKISFDINCVFIELWALVPWVENSKIRLWISPSRWWPLPVSIVYQHIIINQLGCKIFLALAPVNTKNFDEKVGSEHSSTVVHISYKTCYRWNSNPRLLPVVFICIIAASTTGYPVRPSHQASNNSSSSTHLIAS